jgi:Peptidase A4 family
MFSFSHEFSRRAMALLAVSAPIALVGAVGASPPTAYARTVDAQQQSANWAGYVVRSKSAKHFSSVSGSWVQPAVSADSGQGYSAFWVGIGGAGQHSKKLEQVGTSANVVNGKPQYSAWYELVPAPETKLHLAVHPGDHISARVDVRGSQVTVGLSDTTTGKSVAKTLTMSAPDTKTAEWIAEAPSTTTTGNGLQILPLADFGQVTFTNASATAGGHTGPITDPNWTVQKTEMTAGVQGVALGGVTIVPGFPGSLPGASGGASPSDPSAGGTSFSVSYSPAPSAGGSPYPTGSAYPGFGIPGDGYPGYGYGGGFVYLFPGGYAVVI